MEDYAAELRKLAAVLDKAKREIDLAREQSTKPKSLSIRIRGAAVQAARAVIKAVDVGFIELLPPLPWKHEPDGSVADATAFTAWTSFICPVMRSQCATLKANAGAVAHDTDHYDVDDGLEHLRIQASHWEDICDTAADLIREESLNAGNKDRSKKAPKKRPGRKKRSYATIQKEAALVDKWNRAKIAGVYKPDFAKEEGMTPKAFQRMQDRVYRDKRRADNERRQR